MENTLEQDYLIGGLFFMNKGVNMAYSRNYRHYKNSEPKEDRLKKFFIEFITKEGTLPWESGLIADSMTNPSKGVSGEYKGTNLWLTYLQRLMFNFDSDTFLTMNEINQRGGTVNKGEKACLIIYPISYYYDKDDKKLSYKEARELADNGEDITSKFVGYKCYNVFNLAQTNLEYEHLKTLQKKHKKSKTAESILKLYKDCPKISHDPKLGMQRCDGYYSPLTDTVTVGEIGCYKTASDYYMTLFHELAHSTGHEKRLNRKTDHKFGSKLYAQEELVAEISASMMMAKTSLKDNLEKHGAYVKSWIKKIDTIDNFTSIISTAFSRATKAVAWMSGEYVTEEKKTA